VSTAVAIKPEARPITHKVTWGSHTWVCIHPYCDGKNHVYVACEH
jgi:hypothetical protein